MRPRVEKNNHRTYEIENRRDQIDNWTDQRDHRTGPINHDKGQIENDLLFGSLVSLWCSLITNTLVEATLDAH